MEFVGLSADVTRLGGSGWDNVNGQIGVALPIYFLPVIVDVFVYYLYSASMKSYQYQSFDISENI